MFITQSESTAVVAPSPSIRRSCLAALGLLFCLAATAPFAPAADCFVATDGDDSNPGTEARPLGTLRKAAAVVQPGDTVRIRAGEYFAGPTWRVGRAGTAEKPVSYRAFGDGEVRITNGSVVPADSWKLVQGAIYSTEVGEPPMAAFQDALPIHGPGDRAKISSVQTMIANSFYVSGKTLYVWLEGGANPAKSVIRIARGHVISLYDCHHTVLDGLTVEFGFNGIKDQGKGTHHIVIRNCVIRSIASQGIQPVARNCIIEGNLFQKIGSNKYQHGIYGSQPGTVIRNNTFEEIAGAGIHQYNQTKPAGGGCEFSGNVFRKPRSMTVRGRAPGTSYYLDIIAWGEGGNRIFNNVFFGESKRGGISLNSVNNQVCNNTFVGSAYAVSFHKDKPGNSVVNNLVLDAARAFVVWPSGALPQTLDHNLYFNSAAPPRWQRDGRTYETFAAWQKASGEAHSLYADPTLAGPADARLTPVSPAIDAGTTRKEVPLDRGSRPRPRGKAYDIGAYEYGSAR